MSKKTLFAAIALIALGIVFGIVLVSNFTGGVDLSLAREGQEIKIGGQTPIQSESPGLKSISDNFIAVSKAVTPSVVAITVRVSGSKRTQQMPRDFFHFFGPDGEAPPSQGYGSGVIINADGYIVTNNHVVEGADADGIEVILNDKARYRATLVGTDPSTDLAVIKVEGKGLTAAAVANSDQVQVGEWVLAVGNPLQLTSTVTAGIVSAIGRNIDIIEGQYGIEDFIQTDAAINPGNSGGALVNMRGEVVGINTAIATTNQRYQGYGFAVPSNIMKAVAHDLIAHGEVRRGYIGVSIGEVDETMAKAVGLGEARGAFVQSLVPDGAGAAAGVREGDIILSVDAKAVNAPNELQSVIATYHPGDVVTLRIWRDGKEIEKRVTLKSREQRAVATRDSDGRGSETDENATAANRSVDFSSLGLSVRPMTAEEKRQLEVEQGVVVSDVKPFSEAFNRNLRKDQVILEADRKRVSSPSDLKKVLEAKKPGDAVLLKVKAGENTVYLAVQVPK